MAYKLDSAAELIVTAHLLVSGWTRSEYAVSIFNRSYVEYIDFYSVAHLSRCSHDEIGRLPGLAGGKDGGITPRDIFGKALDWEQLLTSRL